MQEAMHIFFITWSFATIICKKSSKLLELPLETFEQETAVNCMDMVFFNEARFSWEQRAILCASN